MITTADRKNVSLSSQPMLDGIGVAVAFIDTDLWRVCHANHLFCQILQRPLDEILKAASIFEFVHSEDRPRHLSCARSHSDGRAERSRFRTRYLQPDGTNVEMLATIAGVKDLNGEVRWINLVLEEVAAPECESDEDASSNGRKHVVFWNWIPESCGTGSLGGPRRRLGGKNRIQSESMKDLIECVHPDDAPALQSLFMRALKGAAGTLDYRLREERAGCRWMREMVSPISDADGNVTNVVGMSIDITDAMPLKRCTQSTKVLSLVRHIEEHWDEPIEFSDLMRRYDVSARSLHSHFRSVGTTPGNFLKRIRLGHARDLLSEPSDTTVAEVCSRCGFGNAGHFAKDYRSQFGELPSETLARARNLKPLSGEVEWLPMESGQVPPPSNSNLTP